MEQIGWILCRLGAIAFWLIGLAIKYLWYAVPGAFKVIWYPRYAPTALLLMLASALDCKLYDKLWLGKYNNWIHLVIILSPFVYFFYLGKHKRNITVKKTIEYVPVHKPIDYVQRPNKDRIKEPIHKKEINQPEPFATQAGDDIRNAKEVDYIEVDYVEVETKEGVV